MLLSTSRHLLCGGLVLTMSLPFAAGAQGGFLTEADPNWREQEVRMPPPPQEDRLREFFVNAASSNRFYVDESSLEVGADYVVRYVMVVRAGGGAETVTYEGIRCTTGERKLYAHWRQDGDWVAPRRSEWESLRSAGLGRPYRALALSYFCDGPAPPRTTADALRGLRHGVQR
jgi:hypothetical protein